MEAPTFEEDEVVIVKEQTNGDTSLVENGERRKKKRESIFETEKEKEEDGTNRLIKNWENGGQSSSSPQRQVKRRRIGTTYFSVQVAAREKSPTLRMYASADKEAGAKKRSVLDRLEDSKFSKSSPPKVFHSCFQLKIWLQENKGQEIKQKKEMADSMRRLFFLPLFDLVFIFILKKVHSSRGNGREDGCISAKEK